MKNKVNTLGVNSRLAQAGAQIKQEQDTVERTVIIPIDSIEFNKDNIFNKDDSEESIIELAENIQENGLLHNIVVVEKAPNRYLLISGERRTRAAIHLGYTEIKATVKKDLTDLEVLKMLFFANSETREYTTEEKVQIIEGFLAKIKQFEQTPEKESAKRFSEYVAQAFNVSTRQANKLISITSELTVSLKKMLYDGVIDTNTAAALAQLPTDYQQYAVDIIEPYIDKKKEELDYAIERALDFAKRVKNIISKTNSSLAKQKASNVYYSGRLTQAKEELEKIDKALENASGDDEQTSELTIRKLNIEKDLAKFNAKLTQFDKDVDIETQKQSSEVKKIYDVTFCSVNRGLDDVQKDDTGVIAQTKKIEREIHKISKSLDKLLVMKPTKELNKIRELLEIYKDSFGD
ncbi:ParB N-terminal domain-containing protein [Ruminococcus sp.]|uniref:ParB/RepB/Spo0J family partition protein n=1 Tax=Ruminococcus sp. TaxID=41978 RepID=UPI001B534847|nr:ParB N-terminal domain-containing protein [Ruminococcus sp.]MBP5433582.1 ParB N-terminal domain-containing protein [Ruminococcus sp.]